MTFSHADRQGGIGAGGSGSGGPAVGGAQSPFSVVLTLPKSRKTAEDKTAWFENKRAASPHRLGKMGTLVGQ
jgi:hypothetical protein